jgi:hypothetical protein
MKFSLLEGNGCDGTALIQHVNNLTLAHLECRILVTYGQASLFGRLVDSADLFREKKHR